MTAQSANREPQPALDVVNFSHPLDDSHLAQIAGLAGRNVGRVFDIPAAIRQEEPLVPQAVALIESVPFSPREWQTHAILVNLPGLAPLAAVTLAELHGRMGHFPAILRLRPDSDAPTPRYVVAEIINLQATRDTARTRRAPRPSSANPTMRPADQDEGDPEQ